MSQQYFISDANITISLGSTSKTLFLELLVSESTLFITRLDETILIYISIVGFAGSGFSMKIIKDDQTTLCMCDNYM